METRSTSIDAGSSVLSLRGIAGSPGLAIGRVVVMRPGRGKAPKRHIPAHLVDEEHARLEQAVAKAVKDLREVALAVESPRLANEAGILDAYGLMLADQSLLEDVRTRITDGHMCAEWAIEASIGEMALQLSSAGNPYLAERSHDFHFIGDLLIRALDGHYSAVPALAEPAVVVAYDLSPAETATLDKDKVLGIVTETGTRTAHTAILARALEIPAVVGVEGLLGHVSGGDTVIVDGSTGEIVVSPTDEMLSLATSKAEGYLERTRSLHEVRSRPARTQCGAPLTLRANVESPAGVGIALYEGAQGVGLYRTEYLYVNRNTLPDEQEQFETYRDVVLAAAGEQVTLRTFDLGGDKIAELVTAKRERNPSLGERAIRFGLSHPELLLVQLRAMIRASAFGEVRIMVPLISTVTEILQVRHLFGEALAEVDARENRRAPNIALGAMVEVPAAALMSHALAPHVEFFSVGTNDLVQYTLAVDRGSQRLAHLASHFDPAVLRLLDMIVNAGSAHSVPVSVCGAMASDPLAAVLLIGLGLREFSLEASAIAEIKEALGNVEVARAEALVRRCLLMSTAAEVLCSVEDEFSEILTPKTPLDGARGDARLG